jgi:hypothetical protein
VKRTRVPVPSSELGPPPPTPQAIVSPPLVSLRGEEQHSPACKGGLGPNSDDWNGSLALCILCAVDAA